VYVFVGVDVVVLVVEPDDGVGAAKTTVTRRKTKIRRSAKIRFVMEKRNMVTISP
jgi:hypothetical protein